MTRSSTRAPRPTRNRSAAAPNRSPDNRRIDACTGRTNGKIIENPFRLLFGEPGVADDGNQLDGGHMAISVGIDVAKDVHWVCAIDQDARVLIDRAVDNT